MANLTPKQAARAAADSYLMKKSTNVAEAFADLSDQFDFSPASRFKGISGGALLMKETGFGVIARGKGIYAGDALVVVRGTGSLLDVISDLHVGRTAVHKGKVVHSGFNKVFNAMDIEHLFQQHFAGKNLTRVHCVGHSLGGAVATLVADWAARKGMQAKLYTFGCPRVGHRGFAQDFTLRVKAQNIFRVYHSSDYVPMVPVWPFLHVPDQGTKSCYIDFHTLNPLRAHSSANYLANVKHATSFNQLRQKPPTVNWDAETKTWLRQASSQGVVLNSQTYTLISHSMAWLFKQILSTTMTSIQEGGGTVSDYLDRVAIYLHMGAKTNKEIEGDVKGLLQKMMAAVGINPGSLQALTINFIRWVFTMFTNTLYHLARTALRAEQVAR